MEQSKAKTLAYPRKSSHLNKIYFLRKIASKALLTGEAKKPKNQPCPYTHYGIDFADLMEKTGKIDMLGQRGKTHLLFGKLGDIGGRNWLFLKLEEHGLGSGDFLSHALSFVKSKLGLLEKPTGVYRKERVPKKFLDTFMAIMKKLGFSSSDLSTVEKNAKAFGISFFTKLTNPTNRSILAKIGASSSKVLGLKDALDNYFKIVTRVGKYKNDYCVRIGDEIIIPSTQLNCK